MILKYCVPGNMRFDLVIFDIDGTLIDSGEVWAPAVQRAMREVYEENGVPLEVPSLRELEAMIGIPGHQALHPFIPEAHRGWVPEISRRVGIYGATAMKGGAGRAIEGARETLKELRARGRSVALASNCGNSYLSEVQERLDLGPLIDRAYCLETPGVRSKADMVSRALEDFGTRRALMVGDRFLDLEAAHSNGLPFLGFSSGFGESAEWKEAEGAIQSYSEFFPTLAKRGALLDSLADELLSIPGLRSIRVSGLPSSGRSLFVRDLEDAVRERGSALRACEAGGGEAHVFIEAEEGIALRRFEGRRRGADSAAEREAFLARFREAKGIADSRRSGDHRLRIDNSNLLDPRRKP